MSDLVRAFGLISKALEELGIPFVIGGSFASNTHGVARSTQDVDLVVELLHPVEMLIRLAGQPKPPNASPKTESHALHESCVHRGTPRAQSRLPPPSPHTPYSPS